MIYIIALKMNLSNKDSIQIKMTQLKHPINSLTLYSNQS